MPRKVKLILNPMADMGRAWKTAIDLRPIAQEFNGELTWSGTVYPTHANPSDGDSNVMTRRSEVKRRTSG